MSIDSQIWDWWDDEYREESQLRAVLVAPISLAEVRAAYEAVRTPGDELQPRVSQLSPTPWGVCLTVEDGADLHRLLDPLMARLDGELRLYRPPVPKLPDAQLWEGRLALKAQPADGPYWTVAPQLLHRVLEAGVTWALEVSGKVYGYSGVWWRLNDPAVIVDVLRKADPQTGARLTVVKGRQFRQLIVQPTMGFASFALPADQDRSPLAALLSSLAEHATYSFLRRTEFPSLLGANWAKNLMPERTDPDVWVLRFPGQERVEESCPLPTDDLLVA